MSEQKDRPELRENFLADLRLLEEHKTSPEWIATKYLYEIALIPDIENICAHCDTPLLREGELYQKLEEAEREERKRISKKLRECFDDRLLPKKISISEAYNYIEQALKGEK